MAATLKNMNAEGFIQRIEDAKEISHDESREELLKKIYRELRPLREEMLKALGREADSMLSLPELDNGSDNTLSVEVSSVDWVDDVEIYTTSLGDMRSLKEVYDLIKQMKLREAHSRAKSLDTAVRERIPESVWDFFEGV